jgi:hypothetical protein
MHDVPLMGRGQRSGDLDSVPERLGQGKGRAGSGQARGQRLALDVLHHQEIDGVVSTDVVEVTDVRVVESGDRARLPFEAQTRLRVGDSIGRNHFDRDGAIEPGIPRAVDLTHPAAAETLVDFVGTEARPGADRHRRP